MKKITPYTCAFLLFWSGYETSLQAEETVFQRELNQYLGVEDSTLSANPVGDATKSLWGEELLQVAGVPTAGKRKMALIRFDALFGDGKNQVPKAARITRARLGLYKVGEEADSGQYASAKPSQLFITLHQMLMPVQPGEPDDESSAYSCYSFRAFGAGDDEYWGDKNRIELGPVQDVDYKSAPVGRVPLEVSMLDTWYWIDLTNQVREWAAGGPNHGFILLAHGWWIGATFASGQYHDPALRPTLIVEWQR